MAKWGGQLEDYLPIHSWFDESKAHLADLRHRALRHHSEGIFLMEKLFGPTLTNAHGRVIPTRFVGEQHVQEDLGWIPTVKDWLENLQLQPWMLKVAVKPSRVEQASSQPARSPTVAPRKKGASKPVTRAASEVRPGARPARKPSRVRR